MTEFERLAEELNVPILLDEGGFYKGITRALAHICTDVIMTANKETDLHEEIKNRFLNKFPYVKK